MDQEILYCMVEDFDCRSKALSKLNSDYFYDYRAKTLYHEIVECYLSTDTIDFPILFNWLVKNGKIKKVTRAFLTEVAENVAKLEIYNFDAYLNQIIKRRKADLTRLLLEDKREQIVTDENSIEDIIRDTRQQITEIDTQCSLSILKPANTKEAKKRILKNKAENKLAHKWQYQSIDEISAIQQSCLNVIAGRPGTGKTTFAMNVLLRNRDLKVAFLSYEMTEDQLLERFIQIKDKHTKKFRDIPDTEIETAIDSFPEIDIYDLSAKNELIIRDIIEQNEYDIVVIDYLQTIKSSVKYKDERMKYNYLVDFINTTRKMFKTSILLLSQVSRSVDSRRPFLSDLKETAAIEESSDMVMFLYRREDVHLDMVDVNRASIEAIIAKNRYGDLSIKDQLMLDFNKKNLNFYCVVKESMWSQT